MSYLYFNEDNLNQIISVDLTLKQIVHISNMLSFHLESRISVDEQDMMEAYEALFAAIESFGELPEEE